METITDDLLRFLADEAALGKKSSQPLIREYHAHPHFAAITDNFSGAAYWPMYPFLYALSRSLQPQKIVELGVEIGRGFIALHLGWPEAEITGVDILDLTGPRTAVAPVAKPGKWRIVQSDSLSYAPSLSGIDLLHVDTLHTYEQVSAEWEAYRPLMQPGGLVCVDDADSTNGPGQALLDNVFAPDDLMFLPQLHRGTGYAVVRVG